MRKERIIEVNNKAEQYFKQPKKELCELSLVNIIEFPSDFNIHLFEENATNTIKCKPISKECIRDEIDLTYHFVTIYNEKVLIIVIGEATYQFDLEMELNAYRTVFKNSDDIAFLKNRNGKIIIANNSFCRITSEKSLSNLLGKTFQELLNIEENSSADARIFQDDKEVFKLNETEMIIRNENYELTDGLIHKFFCRKFPVFCNNQVVASATIMTDKTDRYRLEEVNLERQNRINKQKSALITLMQANTVFSDKPDKIFSSVTRICSRATDVERVSVWLYNEEKTALHCIDLYDNSTKKQSSGEILRMEYFPMYRQALSFNLTFTISNVYEDTRTSEFVESYMKPNNIYSMMDAPIRFAGDIIGVLCFEHTDSIRTWFDDEELFATAVADILSQIYSLIKFKEMKQEISNLKSQLNKKQ